MSGRAVSPTPTPKPKTGLNGGIRFCIGVLIALTLGLFMLMWDAGYIPIHSLPPWLGPYVFLPILAVALSFGGSSLVQYLSCNQVQWLTQLQRAAIVPVPFWLLWLILRFFPNMRWPIEGLVQDKSPILRQGLSSGFYTFWIGLYTQSLLIGLAQICPK
jgi:hypothetical protein